MADDVEFSFEDAEPAATLVLGKKKKKKKKELPGAGEEDDADYGGGDGGGGGGGGSGGGGIGSGGDGIASGGGGRRRDGGGSGGGGDDDEDDNDDELGELAASLAKKKKKKKSSKPKGNSVEELPALVDAVDGGAVAAERLANGNRSAIETGPRKRADDEVDDVDPTEMHANGDVGPTEAATEADIKRAKSKKKSSKTKAAGSARGASNGDLDDVDAILAELDMKEKAEDLDAGPGDGPPAPRPAPDAQKKGKKKQQPARPPRDDDDIDAILAELDEPAAKAASSATAPAAAARAQVPTKPSPAAADDLDALITELGGADGDYAAESTKPSSTAAKKAKKKAKGKNEPAASGAADTDDLDALLAELGDGPAPPIASSSDQPGDQSKLSNGDAAPSAADDLEAMLEEGDLDAGPKLSAAAKKKAAKKKKVKSSTEALTSATEVAGEAAPEAPTDAAHAGVPAAGATKKGKKESAAVKRLREQRERQAAEEERLAKLREEEEQRRLEEERLEQEREEALNAVKRAKKEAEKAKKARLKAEGKLLSKAEAAKRRKAENFRMQVLAGGLVPGAALAAAAGSTEEADAEAAKEEANRSRVVYAKKKRGKAGKQGEDGSEANPTNVLSETLDDGQTPVGGTDSAVDGPTAAAKDAEPVGAPVEEIVPDEWEDAEVLRVERANAAATAKAEDEVKSARGYGKTKRWDGAQGGDDEENDESDGESGSDDEDDDDDSEHEGMSKAEIAAEKRRDDIRRIRVKELADAKAARTADDLRSPIICILGHVDTGKTKILDRIRRTNVQDGEAGGITQQIGATYFPIEAVKKETTKMEEGRALAYNVPSLLIIDTPGHESFTNLRSRGSSLCDIAILVVDIMHGLEQQTRESIDLLKLRKTPFIIALNKIDRMYDWVAVPGNCPIRDTLDKQKKHVVDEFRRRTKEAQLQLQEIGFNTELYWENPDVRKNISIVPTSAITGEGIPDLLMLLLSLSQKLLIERLMYCPVLEATVLEVKVIEGLGTTIDIVLTGGTIHEGNTIFVVGLDGPIQTTIRALLTPHPMKEMRVKGQYLHHKEIRAAQGIKISADGLDKAVAGTQIMVAKDHGDADEVEYIKEEVMKDFATILQNVDKSGMGVYVQASTLGSLEALLEFLRTSKIPVSGINIGPVHKKDVTKASTMLEKRKEFATILAFDVPIEREAREMAEDMGVTIFTADIIYHLFDQFTEYMEKMKQSRREQISNDVVFPVILRILRDNIFHNKDPIVMGVDVVEGLLRVGTPLVIRHGTEWLDIGRVVSIEHNTQSVKIAKRGESVCLKVQSPKTEHIMYGRHFDYTDQVVSKMSREAINILKENFRDDLDTEDWRLVVKLKKLFEII